MVGKGSSGKGGGISPSSLARPGEPSGPCPDVAPQGCLRDPQLGHQHAPGPPVVPKPRGHTIDRLKNLDPKLRDVGPHGQSKGKNTTWAATRLSPMERPYPTPT